MALKKHYRFPNEANQPLVQGLRVGRFFKGINVTFIIYHYDGVLIDAAPSNQWSEVKTFVESLSPQRLLLTHHHEDHTGNAANLASRFNLPVYTNTRCAALLQKPFRVPLVRRFIWGKTYSCPLQVIDESDVITSASNKRLRLINAPGHSSDMSCFLAEDDGILFSGDLYISGRVKYLHTDEDLQVFYDSLNKVTALDFSVMCCPHRGIINEGKQALIDKRDFIAEKAQRCQTLYSQGYSIAAIRDQVTGKEDLLSYLTAFEFSKLRFVESALLLKL